MSGEQYNDIQYAIFAMERCARGMRAMGARVEAANPDDPYSAVHYYDDAESIEKAVEALKRIEAAAAPTDAMVEAACKAFSEESFGYSAESRREYMIRSMAIAAAIRAALAAREGR